MTTELLSFKFFNSLSLTHVNFRKNPKIARSYYHPIFYASCSMCYGVTYLLFAIGLKVKYLIQCKFLIETPRGVKEQNARLKLQLHYERNEGKRVIQTKIKSGNTNPTSDKDGKDPPTPLTPPTDNTPTTPPPEKDRKLSNVSKANKSSVKDLTEVKGKKYT